MNIKNGLLVLVLLCLFCNCGFSQVQVSDTNSYFTIAETSVLADGKASFTVRIYIRDGNNQPLKDKSVTIFTARGTYYDSIIQPAVTDFQGQCTGYITSTYGGYDTVSVVCDFKTIGFPFKWSQGTPEDFTAGETHINIDTLTISGFIKIFYKFLNSDILNNDFEDSLSSWTAEDVRPESTTWSVTNSDTYHGNYSVKTHYRNNDPLGNLEAVSVYLVDEDNTTLTIAYLYSPTVDWQEILMSTSSWKGINVKIKLRADLVGQHTVICQTLLASDIFKCSGGVISVWAKVYQEGGEDRGYAFDFIKGGRWEEIAPDTAIFVSKVYDCGIDTPQYSIFQADYNDSGKTILFAVRSADTKEGLASATWYPVVNNGPINAPRKRWVQWKCEMQTDDTMVSPVLDTATINYLAPKSIYFVPAFKLENLLASPDPFSPNGDGVKDTTAIYYELIDSKPQDTISIYIYDEGHTLVRTLLNCTPETVGLHTKVWDGKNDLNAVVPDGVYTYEITAMDSLGNIVTNSGTVIVDVTRPIPGINKVSLGNKQIGLGFTVNEQFAEWQVLRSIDDTTGFVIAGSGTTGLEWQDTSPIIANDRSYYYKIVVTDLAGNTNTTNIVCARLSSDGGIFYNRGQFALPNTIIRCKEDPDAYVTILDTQTFGNTIDLVKIKVAKKSKEALESEGKILPVDKNLVGAYEINAFELDAGFSEIAGIKTWQQGKPIQITLHYDFCPADRISSLAIYEWTGEQWVSIGGSASSATRTISVNINHLSTYAVMYQTASAFVGAKPNPFTPNGDGINDYVEIRFENPEGIEVKLSIFDLTGTTVRTKDYPAGTTSVTWDGRDITGRVVEGGAYIWQVEIGTRVVNGVVVVAK